MSGETKIYELLAVGGEVHKYLVRAKAYERVRDWILRKEAYPILILGASGVGKTSLIKSLCNEPAYIRRQDRTEESHSVVRKIDSSYLKLIDTPGEQLHEARRKVAIREGQRSSIGIINVVCFGYHEGVRGASEAVNDGMPSTDYLERQRLVEIERLSEWASILCGKGGSASWITTVCTKADLWWTVSEEQPVLDYYRSHSDYANRMSQDGFPPHAVKSYSSINNLFFGQAKMSGYYSERLRGEDRSSLIAHLLDRPVEMNDRGATPSRQMDPENDVARKQFLVDCLDRLNIIGRKLRLISRLALFLTVIHLIILALVFGISTRSLYFNSYSLTFLFYSEISTLLCILLVLYYMEYMAKNGDMYYQAVSDEFENYPYNDKLFFEARISLRGFIINTSLPFYREGKNGPGIYLLLNVAMAIGMIVLTTMSGLNFRLQ